MCGITFAMMAVAGRVQAQSFRAFTSALTGDGGPYFSGGADEVGGSYNDSNVPKNLSLQGYSKTFSGPDGNVTFNAAAAVDFRGFFSTGSYAYGDVLNAYYPTTPPPGKEPPFGYYVLGGGGSWTQHTFVSPQALTGPYADFHWHVSGTATANIGTANSRLDFAVTTGATSFDDLYNSAVTPNLMTQFGPGTYSYHTAIALDTPLDFLFWGSSYWEVDATDLQTLGSTHKELQGYANFFNTFNLDSIDVFNGDGTPVTQWSLLDTQGNVIFNQNGRVSAVPEPGIVALLVGMGVSGTVFLKRRKRTKNAPECRIAA